MSKIFTISDNHFGHANILEYEKTYRPFKSVAEMNKFMVDQWNSVVGENDTVIHCGDFALGDVEFIEQLVRVLNGHIILIRGNHDRRSTKKFKECGFLEVYKKLRYGAFIFTHNPLPYGDIPDGMINIHGHNHSKQPAEFQTDKHWNVSCEMLNSTPVELNLNLVDESRQRGG